MVIYVFVVWVIAGVFAVLNDIAKTASKGYWKTMFWLTYIVLMVKLVSDIFV